MTDELFAAVRSGDANRVTDLISKGADVNAKDNKNYTPLHLAARNGHFNIVEKLIEKEADINAKTNRGYTSLHLAALNGHLNVVKKLIEEGADINAKNNRGYIPLVTAAASVNFDGKLQVVEELIDKGANVNARANHGNTLLHWAVESGYLSTIEKLIEKGADINAKNNNKNTPLHLAARSDYLNIIEKLVEQGANINAKNNNKNTPMYEAAIYDKLQVVERLIEKGADINAKNDRGCTILHWTAKNGYLNLVEKLIEKGADTSSKNDNGDTPLHFAALGGNLKIVKRLIEKGVDINAKNKNDDTPLHLTAIIGHSEVAEFLISKHADINIKNKDDWTPLDSAAALSKWDDDWVPLSSEKALGKMNIIKLLGKENSSEMLNLLKERIRKNEEIMQLKLQEYINFLPTHVDNRRSVAQEDKNSLQSDKIGPNKIGVTSGTSKLSSFINTFAYTMIDTIKDIFQSASSPFKAAIGMEPSKAITVQGIDSNGILLLLDVFISRRFIGQKYISTVDQSVPLLEVQGHVLKIIEEFEKVVNQAALKSGISMHRLNIDYVEMKKEVTAKIMSGKFNEIPEILNSYVEKACPGIEAGCPGKLSPKKFDKFMVEFNSRLNVISMQQMLHNRIEVSDEQINLRPQSYLSNTSVQGHLTWDKVKLID